MSSQTDGTHRQPDKKGEVEYLTKLLENGRLEVGVKAIERLAQIKNTNAIKALVQALNYDSFYLYTSKALLDIGEPAMLILLEAIKDKNNISRHKIADTLGGYSDERVIASLIKTFEDEDSQLRSWVIYALTRFPDKQVSEKFIEIMQNDKDKQVRMFAALKLGERKDRTAVEALIKMLEIEDVEERSKAILSLGMIGDIRAVEPIIQIMNSSHINFRRMAILSLGMIGDIRAVEPIIEMLKNKKENASVQYEAIEALIRFGEVKAIEPIIQLLSVDDDLVRDKAAEALGVFGDIQAVEPLLQIIQDQNNMVRSKVIEALTLLNDVRALPLLKVISESDTHENEWGEPLRDVAYKAIQSIKGL